MGDVVHGSYVCRLHCVLGSGVDSGTNMTLTKRNTMQGGFLLNTVGTRIHKIQNSV